MVHYAGGKAFLIPDILDLYRKIDANVVIEPFGGSAKFLLNIEQYTLDGVKTVVYNDRDRRVSNLFRQVKDNADELAEKFRWVINSRDWWNDFNHHESADPIEDAFRTLYVLALGRPERNFNAYGWRINDSDRLNDVMARIFQIHKIVRKWIVECDDYLTVMRRYNFPNAFFYLDPPYSFSQYRSDKRYRFEQMSYHQLNHMLHELKGHYLMNLDDSQMVREVFGEPQMAKEYKNVSGTVHKVDTRTELFYHNLTV